MHKAFEHVSIAGTSRPGETYVLAEDRPRPCDDIDDLYALRTDEEILLALDMDINLACGEFYETRKFLGVTRISEDDYIIRVRCYEKGSKRLLVFAYCLHRVRSFQEELARVKELFELE